MPGTKGIIMMLLMAVCLSAARPVCVALLRDTMGTLGLVRRVHCSCKVDWRQMRRRKNAVALGEFEAYRRAWGCGMMAHPATALGLVAGEAAGLQSKRATAAVP